MEKDIDKYKVFTRRSFLIGAGQLAITAGLTARLGYLQLAEGERYKTLADKNRIDMRLITPSRGLIYDRSGKILAGNEQSFRLLITPEQAGDIDALIKDLERYVEITKFEIEDFKERSKGLPKFVSVELKSNLSWDEVSKIEVHAASLPGAKIEMGEQRFYPKSEANAHIVGYVGAISKTDIKKDDSLQRLPNLRIGKTGIEKEYEPYLRGRAGSRKMEVNVAGREVRELEKTRSKRGDPVVLSLDTELQEYVYKQLSKHKSASAVVMDCKTGAVYAAASFPGFDPNLFVKGLSPEKWQELLSNQTYPLTNKAISGQYSPGSTFKMVTALAALEHGYTDYNKTVNCPGHYDLGGDRFHCWKRGGHGKMNLVQALEQSCDTYFYEIAVDMGIDKIADMAHRLGLGVKLDFDLKEEREGLIPSERWKLGHIGTRWQKGDTVVAAIGQGYIQTTPLQLAVMEARLVNGGYDVKPWVADKVGMFDRHPSSWPKMDVSQKHLKYVLEGMNRVVNNPKGTAYGSKIWDDKYSFGGKTGTAQVRRITTAQRQAGVRQEDLPWRHRHHALFVGFAPVDNPRYVCATVIEHGIGGSSTAAPLTRDILLKAQKLKIAENKIFNPFAEKIKEDQKKA